MKEQLIKQLDVLAKMAEQKGYLEVACILKSMTGFVIAGDGERLILLSNSACALAKKAIEEYKSEQKTQNGH